MSWHFLHCKQGTCGSAKVQPMKVEAGRRLVEGHPRTLMQGSGRSNCRLERSGAPFCRSQGVRGWEAPSGCQSSDEAVSVCAPWPAQRTPVACGDCQERRALPPHTHLLAVSPLPQCKYKALGPRPPSMTMMPKGSVRHANAHKHITLKSGAKMACLG